MPRELSNSVILPKEDFYELSEVAFSNSHVPSAGERIGSIFQTTMVLGAIAGAVTLGTWGWAMAIEWHEKKALERKMTELQFRKDNAPTTG